MKEFFTNPDGAFSTVVYTLGSLLFLILGRWIYQLLHRDIRMNEELVEHDNLAFAFANVGYLAGVIIALGGVLTGDSTGSLLYDFVDFCLYATLSVFLLNMSVILNDRIVLRGVDLKHELVNDRNAGVGVLEGAISIATGLIIYGAVSGDSLHEGVNGYLSTVIFWAVGMVIFVVSTFVYNAILSFDLMEEIERDNVAVGVAYSGVVISIANLIRSGIQGDFVSWEVSAYQVAYNTGIALAVLPLVRFVADKILLPGQKLSDELVLQEKPNVGAGVIEAFAYIACSVLLDWTL